MQTFVYLVIIISTRNGDNDDMKKRRIRQVASTLRGLDLVSFPPFMIHMCIIVAQGWLKWHRRIPGETYKITDSCHWWKKCKRHYRHYEIYWCGVESVKTVSTANFLKLGCTTAALATNPPIEWPTNMTLLGRLPEIEAPSFARASRDSLYWSKICNHEHHNSKSKSWRAWCCINSFHKEVETNHQP